MHKQGELVSAAIMYLLRVANGSNDEANGSKTNESVTPLLVTELAALLDKYARPTRRESSSLTTYWSESTESSG
jgi:hypothetical protein